MSTRDCDCENLGKVNRRGAIRSAVASSMLFSGILQQLAADEGPANREKTGGEKPSGHQQVHFPPKAKRVIYLFQAGAPSHLELFDNKPELTKWNGKLPPSELLKGYRAAFIDPNSKLLGPKFKFARHGKSGAEISELMPHLAGVADDITIVK